MEGAGPGSVEVKDIDWVERLVDGRVLRFERTSTGSSRATFLVDVVRGDGTTLELVLRRDTGDGPLSNTELSLERESKVYRALARTDVLIPELVGVAPDGKALVTARARGQESLGPLCRTEREEVVDSYVRAIAVLHGIDVAELELRGFARPGTGPAHATNELDLWERIFKERVRRPAPLVRFAFGWLRDHAPAQVDRTVLCHGDAGPGNFLFDRSEVTALLDWEFAHIGDPMDDLAWLTVRGNHLSGVGDQERNFALYTRLTGIPVDASRVRYYQAMVLLRMAVSCLVALDAGSAGIDLAVHFSLLPAVERLLPLLVAEMSGVGVPEGAQELPVRSTTSHDEVLEFVKETVLRLSKEADQSSRTRLRGISGLLAHLEAAGRYGEGVEAASASAFEGLLGERPGSTEAGLSRLDDLIRRGSAPAEPELVRFFCEQGGLKLLLWPASARMAHPIAPVVTRHNQQPG